MRVAKQRPRAARTSKRERPRRARALATTSQVSATPRTRLAPSAAQAPRHAAPRKDVAACAGTTKRSVIGCRQVPPRRASQSERCAQASAAPRARWWCFTRAPTCPHKLRPPISRSASMPVRKRRSRRLLRTCPANGAQDLALTQVAQMRRPAAAANATGPAAVRRGGCTAPRRLPDVTAPRRSAARRRHLPPLHAAQRTPARGAVARAAPPAAAAQQACECCDALARPRLAGSSGSATHTRGVVSVVSAAGGRYAQRACMLGESSRNLRKCVTAAARRLPRAPP